MIIVGGRDFVRNNKMDKQEMIELLNKNGIEPDERCSQEDLEALIDYEEILMQ